jgi:glucose-6-phosphate dehydrogenase assembly protein OpcA
MLVLAVDRAAAEPSVSARVSSHCRLANRAGKQICWEQVTIEARGALVETRPSAVAPLLAPDLPTFLWWRTSPDFGDRVFARLARMADRVVVDSAAFARPGRGPVELAAALRATTPDSGTLSDFEWQRLTPWRMLFASFYDVADYRPVLDRVDGLTIEYASCPHTGDMPPKAILLASWLAERLGWEFDGAAPADGGVAFSAGGRTVRVRFEPVEWASVPGGRLASAALTVSGGPEAVFRVARSEDRSKLASEVTIGGERHARRVLAYEATGEAELLASELAIPAHDRLYEAAVRIAGKIAEAHDTGG